MTNYKEELERIEKQVTKNREEQIKLQERKKHLEEEHAKILGELKKEEIKEKELQDKINELEIEIEQEINKCKEILK